MTEAVYNVKLKSTAHCNREVQGIITTNLFQVDQAIEKGASIQSISYVLRYPEVMLCDLSNPEYPLNLCETQTIQDCFTHIQELLPKYIKNSDIRKITGDGLDTEIAICGPDKKELLQLKECILNEVYTINKVNSKLSFTPFHSRGVHLIRDINTLSPSVMKRFTTFIEEYKKYISPSFHSKIKFFQQKYSYQNHHIWYQIKNIGASKLFILTAGLPMALGYMQSTQDENIHFCEIHRENDPYQLYRVKEFDSIFPQVRDTNNWVIIDKVYTGGTIVSAAEKLQAHLGPNIAIRKVGLFPKTYDSIKNLDYVVYAGRLFSSDFILRNCSKEFWHIELLYLKEKESALSNQQLY